MKLTEHARNHPLSVGSDAKTVKGEKKGYLTGILYLAPSTMSGYDMCPMSTMGCEASCLGAYAGRVTFTPGILKARMAKAQWYMEDREEFLSAVYTQIAAIKRKAERLGMIPAIRLNGSSDLPKMALAMVEAFPNVQFYDYTKIPMPWLRVRNNYSLTFSRSETNGLSCIKALEHGVNVCVVFDTPKGKPLPKKFGFAPHWYDVFDADDTDLRFLDPKGVVVGVRAKGKKAKHDTSGFVILGQ